MTAQNGRSAEENRYAFIGTRSLILDSYLQNLTTGSGGRRPERDEPAGPTLKNAAAAISDAQYALETELADSLAKLKRFIDESEKISARVEALLKEEEKQAGDGEGVG